MHLRTLRGEVRALLSGAAWPELRQLARGERRVLTVLVALTYDPDPGLVDAAIRGFGLATDALADIDAEFVRGHLRRLVWLMSDESGGICPRAPELLAAAIVARPAHFAAFLPVLESLLDTEPRDADQFRPSWERGMALLRSQELSAGSPHLAVADGEGREDKGQPTDRERHPCPAEPG